MRESWENKGVQSQWRMIKKTAHVGVTLNTKKEEGGKREKKGRKEEEERKEKKKKKEKKEKKRKKKKKGELNP